MNDKNLKDLVEKQIDNFLYAGEVALDLRNKGLNKEIKSDEILAPSPDWPCMEDLEFLRF